MNWLFPSIAFLIGAMVAALMSDRWSRTAPEWSQLRRMLSAAAVVPLVIFILALLGSAWAYATLPDSGEGGREIVIFVLILVGSVLGVSALVGGLVGAGLAERSQRQ